MTRIDRPLPSAADHIGLAAWLEQAATRLGPHEIRRRMVHILPGFLPFILWPIPHEDPLSQTLKNVMIGLAVGISVWAWMKRSIYARRGEKSQVAAVFGYAANVLGLLILIPSSPELGLAVMGIIAFGDGSATLAGLVFGGRRLPWNRAKSWTGLAAFLTCSIPMATMIYVGEAQPGVSVATGLCCVAPAALVAALAESLPWKINDNIRVGLAAAMTIIPLHAMFVGW
jgi:phytol kinase